MLNRLSTDCVSTADSRKGAATAALRGGVSPTAFLLVRALRQTAMTTFSRSVSLSTESVSHVGQSISRSVSQSVAVSVRVERVASPLGLQRAAAQGAANFKSQALVVQLRVPARRPAGNRVVATGGALPLPEDGEDGDVDGRAPCTLR
eukprot:Selendium_serpulae@DN5542_c0_g1_i1.p1